MIEEMLPFAVSVSAALETKLLLALIEAPRTPAEHARALGLDPRATGRVLDVLVAFGLAARTGETVGASPELVTWTRRLPGATAETFLGLLAHATEFVKTGKPYWRMDGEDKARYATVVGGLGRMAEPAAKQLAARLELSPPPARILDIGCGSGVWGFAIATRYPNARVTGLDQAGVLETFRTRAQEAGLTDRIESLPGDVHELALQRVYDLVIIANVLRLDEPDRARHIVERAASALADGGTMIIVDALAGGTPEREQARATYALHLSMRTERGQVYSPETVFGWLAGAGIGKTRLESFDVGPGAMGAVIASR
jgi:C-methyltransferase